MVAESQELANPLMLAVRAAVAYATHTYWIAAVRYMVHISDTITENGTQRKITARVILEDQVHNYTDDIGSVDSVSWQAALAALATYDCQNNVLVCWNLPEGRMVCLYKKAQLPPTQSALYQLATT